MSKHNTHSPTSLISTFYRPHSRYILDCGTELITSQAHKDECDINNILTQYKKTGIITHITNQQPIYADLPETSDFQNSLSIISQAEEAFATIPSKIRDEFHNNPAEFLEALHNPAERERMMELGFIQRPVEPARLQPAAGTEPPVQPSSAGPDLGSKHE